MEPSARVDAYFSMLEELRALLGMGIDPAKRIEGSLDQLFYIAGFPDIARLGHGSSPKRFDQPGGLIQLMGCAGDDGDISPFLGEGNRRGPADPPPPTGDDRNLVLQARHRWCHRDLVLTGPATVTQAG